jgi:hypothetical protein
MLNLNSVMIGTQQLTALATFYEHAIGKPADMVDSDLGFYGWQVGSAFFSVLEHSAMGGTPRIPDASCLILKPRRSKRNLSG